MVFVKLDFCVNYLSEKMENLILFLCFSFEASEQLLRKLENRVSCEGSRWTIQFTNAHLVVNNHSQQIMVSLVIAKCRGWVPNGFALATMRGNREWEGDIYKTRSVRCCTSICTTRWVISFYWLLHTASFTYFGSTSCVLSLQHQSNGNNISPFSPMTLSLPAKIVSISYENTPHHHFSIHW